MRLTLLTAAVTAIALAGSAAAQRPQLLPTSKVPLARGSADCSDSSRRRSIRETS
jgi:hypothetical protein